MAGIVGVHGVWNYLHGKTVDQAEDHLSRVWTANLARSLGHDARVDVAYYSPQLRRGSAQSAPNPDTLDEDQQQWLAEWDQALSPRTEHSHGRALKPVRQIFSGMARRGNLNPELVSAFVTVFLNEVKVYFDQSDHGPRQACRDAVAATIRRVKPSVVISHSMGSIVTYEALWQNPDLQVDLLMTLGSPLALPGVIFPRLDPAPVDGRGDRPPGVTRWVNIADPGDLCAVPRWLGKSFDGIDEDLETPIGVFEFHKVAKYLQSEKVGSVIQQWRR